MGKRMAKVIALRLAAEYLRADTEEAESNLIESDGLSDDEAKMIVDQLMLIADKLEKQGDQLAKCLK